MLSTNTLQVLQPEAIGQKAYHVTSASTFHQNSIICFQLRQYFTCYTSYTFRQAILKYIDVQEKTPFNVMQYPFMSLDNSSCNVERFLEEQNNFNQLPFLMTAVNTIGLSADCHIKFWRCPPLYPPM